MRSWRSGSGRAIAIGLPALLLLSGCSAVAPSPSTSSPASAGVGSLRLPHVVHAYFLGDSWSAGFKADPRRAIPQITSQALGWSETVDAVPGTGYVHVDTPGTHTFAYRAEHVAADVRADVVVVQGSVNDARSPINRLPSAVDATLSALHHRFPRTPIVMLGPAPATLPVTSTLRQIDAILRERAAAAHVIYVSPLSDAWINQDNIAEIIDPATGHPTVTGDAYLGGRFASVVLDLERGPAAD